MAKHFKFRIAIGGSCQDICTGPCTFHAHTTHSPAHIGSIACKECNHHKEDNDNENWITCPKIMYRHPKTGNVVMRKH